MKIKKITRLLTVGLLSIWMTTLVGCTSGVADSKGFKSSQSFDIAQDGSKRFRYWLYREEGKAFLSASSGRFDAEKFERFVDRRVSAVIESTAFCRDGYFIYERVSHPNDAYVKGECRDTASQADRERWG